MCDWMNGRFGQLLTIAIDVIMLLRFSNWMKDWIGQCWSLRKWEWDVGVRSRIRKNNRRRVNQVLRFPSSVSRISILNCLLIEVLFMIQNEQTIITVHSNNTTIHLLITSSSFLQTNTANSIHFTTICCWE